MERSVSKREEIAVGIGITKRDNKHAGCGRGGRGQKEKAGSKSTTRKDGNSSTELLGERVKKRNSERRRRKSLDVKGQESE